MIKLCDTEIKAGHFPDKTQCIRIPLELLEEEEYRRHWRP